MVGAMERTAPGATGFRVIKPGMLTLLQDLGRFGVQHLGLASGGAADEQAFLWANRLLGNRPGAAALEICVGGLVLEVQVPTRLALTGADLQATLNGRALTPWQTAWVAPGDRLQFVYPRSGLRAYLAVQGGFDVAPTLGSVSTVMREGVGGLDGQGSPIRIGDVLPCPSQEALAKGGIAGEVRMRVPETFVPDYREPLTLRLIEPGEKSHFSADQYRQLYANEYRLSAQSDRMGVRLSGESLKPDVAGILSEGTSFGSVQVPPDGQPIVLLKDRQTIGGYPKIGTVFALDAFALAQRQPHVLVRFEPVAPATAEHILSRFYRFFGRR